MRIPALIGALAAFCLQAGAAQAAVPKQKPRPGTAAQTRKAPAVAPAPPDSTDSVGLAPLEDSKTPAATKPRADEPDLVVLPVPAAQSGTPAPTAALAPATAKADAAASAPDPTRASKLRLTPAVGFGITTESEFDGSAPSFAFGAALEYAISPKVSVLLQGRDVLYRRTYVTNRPDLALQQAAQVSVDEQKIGGDALFAWDLARTFKWSDRLALAFLAGPSTRFFVNDAERSSAGSVAAGARISYVLSDSLDLGCSGLYGYNFLFKNEELTSALGGPKGIAEVNGSVGLKLAPDTRFGIGYEGELVVLAASYRLYHSLAFTFDIGF